MEKLHTKKYAFNFPPIYDNPPNSTLTPEKLKTIKSIQNRLQELNNIQCDVDNGNPKPSTEFSTKCENYLLLAQAYADINDADIAKAIINGLQEIALELILAEKPESAIMIYHQINNSQFKSKESTTFINHLHKITGSASPELFSILESLGEQKDRKVSWYCLAMQVLKTDPTRALVLLDRAATEGYEKAQKEYAFQMAIPDLPDNEKKESPVFRSDLKPEPTSPVKHNKSVKQKFTNFFSTKSIKSIQSTSQPGISSTTDRDILLSIMNLEYSDKFVVIQLYEKLLSGNEIKKDEFDSIVELLETIHVENGSGFAALELARLYVSFPQFLDSAKAYSKTVNCFETAIRQNVSGAIEELVRYKQRKPIL